MLLHGFLGRAADWDAVCAAFPAGVRCLALDLPGHGDADLAGTRELSLARVADDLLGRLDALAIDRFSLLGYSLGGRVALAMALRARRRCARLILESANPGLETSELRAARAARDRAWAARLAQEGAMSAFLRRWYDAPLWSTLRDRPELLEALIGQRSAANPAAMSRVLAELSPGLQAPMWDELPGLSTPTLLIAGARDPAYAALSARMVALLPNARRWLAPGAGHNVHLEAPEAFASQVQRFLSSAPVEP